LIVLFGVQPGLVLTLVQGTVVDTLDAVRGGVPIGIGPEVLVIGLAVIVVLIIARTLAALFGSRSEPAPVAEGGAR